MQTNIKCGYAGCRRVAVYQTNLKGLNGKLCLCKEHLDQLQKKKKFKFTEIEYSSIINLLSKHIHRRNIQFVRRGCKK